MALDATGTLCIPPVIDLEMPGLAGRFRSMISSCAVGRICFGKGLPVARDSNMIASVLAFISPKEISFVNLTPAFAPIIGLSSFGMKSYFHTLFSIALNIFIAGVSVPIGTVPPA